MKLKNLTFVLALVASLLSLIYTGAALAQKGPNENATFSVDFDISAGNQGDVTYDSAQAGDYATFEVRVDGVVELKRYKVKIEFDTAFVELIKGNILFEHPGVAPNPPIEVNILESTGGEAPAPGAIDDSYGAGIYEAGFTLGNVADTLSEMPHGEGLLLFCYPQLKDSFTDFTAIPIKILTAALDDKNNVRDEFTLNQSYWILGDSAVIPELTIVTTSLSSGAVDSAYSDALEASGGTPPYTWSIVSGGLPTGLSLEDSTGIISGVPTDTGTSDFTVMVKDAVPDSATKDLSITIIELAPVIVVTPDSLDFDSVYVDSSVSLELTVKNEGTADLIVSEIISDNLVFTTDFSGPDTLAPDGSLSVNVTFTPDMAQAETGTLTIFNNDHTVLVALTGIGLPPTPQIRVEPDSLAFGEVTVDSSFTQIFTIYNDGNANLVVDSIIYPEAYSGTIASATIPPSGSIVDSVTFAPPDTFFYGGSIDIYNNDVLKTVQVTGTGTAEPVPKIVVNPTSLAFGDVVVGSFSQLNFTISNEGGATLEVYDINPPPAYTVSDTSFSIEPNDSVVVTVIFTPPDTGSYTDSIEILNNDVTKTVDVSGRGIVYDVGVDVTSCPDTLWRDVPDTIKATITNLGNVTAGDITVTGWLEPDSAGNCTTFVIPTLAAGQSLDFAFELLFDDPESRPYVGYIRVELTGDSNSENDYDQCSFYYEEVESRRIGPELPQAYSLSQNYPNPFNPLTQIEYSIPHRGWVRLEVYNIVGEKVATLVDRLQEPGYYRIGWDAGDLRSGVYFCRMETGSFAFTRRMVLLK